MFKIIKNPEILTNKQKQAFYKLNQIFQTLNKLSINIPYSTLYRYKIKIKIFAVQFCAGQNSRNTIYLKSDRYLTIHQSINLGKNSHRRYRTNRTTFPILSQN
jgi:hypothetical protein